MEPWIFILSRLKPDGSSIFFWPMCHGVTPNACCFCWEALVSSSQLSLVPLLYTCGRSQFTVVLLPFYCWEKEFFYQTRYPITCSVLCGIKSHILAFTMTVAMIMSSSLNSFSIIISKNSLLIFNTICVFLADTASAWMQFAYANPRFYFLFWDFWWGSI